MLRLSDDSLCSVTSGQSFLALLEYNDFLPSRLATSILLAEITSSKGEHAIVPEVGWHGVILVTIDTAYDHDQEHCYLF